MGSGERILLVDDDLAVLGIGRQMLIHFGYRVETGASPEEALEKFSADPGGFELVITDQAMPQMTGAQLATEMIRIRPDIPIIMTSGMPHDIADWLKKNGIIRRFIEKPFHKETVGRIVSETLGNRQAS